MFVRVTWIEGSPDQLERGVSSFQSQVAEPFREAPGFLGAVLLANKQAGHAAAVTYWESEQALETSEERANSTRAQARDSSGVQVRDVERFEIALQLRKGAPAVGSGVRVNNVRGAPDKADEGIRFVRDRVAPLVKGQQGFRALLFGLNRENGRSVVATVWDSVAARDASEQAVAGVRQEGSQQVQSSDTSVELYEVAFADLKDPALAAGS